MDVLDAIHRRRAIRDYRPDKLPASRILQLIAAAGWAPSAMNEQPWQFTVVTDRALMDRLSAQAKTFMLESMGDVPNPAHFQDLLRDPTFHILYNAPLLVVVSAPAARQWCIEDCAVAAQNLMLAATDMGLGSCWIGFAQGWLNTKEGLASLGLSAQSRVVAPIVLGVPAAPPPAVQRKSPAINWIGDREPLLSPAFGSLG